MGNKLEPVIDKLSKLNLIDSIDPEEINELIDKFNIKEQDYEKVARTVIYVRERLINKQSRYNAFKSAFPNRLVGSRRAIETKAKRVEEYKIYKYLVSILSTSTYILYAIERTKVLDEALDRIFDKETKNRDRAEFMKLFLQETRKDNNSKSIELNLEVNQGNVSITSIEDKLSDISTKLNGFSAKQIIELNNDN